MTSTPKAPTQPASDAMRRAEFEARYPQAAKLLESAAKDVERSPGLALIQTFLAFGSFAIEESQTRRAKLSSAERAAEDRKTALHKLMHKAAPGLRWLRGRDLCSIDDFGAVAGGESPDSDPFACSKATRNARSLLRASRELVAIARPGEKGPALYPTEQLIQVALKKRLGIFGRARDLGADHLWRDVIAALGIPVTTVAAPASPVMPPKPTIERKVAPTGSASVANASAPKSLTVARQSRERAMVTRRKDLKAFAQSLIGSGGATKSGSEIHLSMTGAEFITRFRERYPAYQGIGIDTLQDDRRKIKVVGKIGRPSAQRSRNPPPKKP